MGYIPWWGYSIVVKTEPEQFCLEERCKIPIHILHGIQHLLYEVVVGCKVAESSLTELFLFHHFRRAEFQSVGYYELLQRVDGLHSLVSHLVGPEGIAIGSKLVHGVPYSCRGDSPLVQEHIHVPGHLWVCTLYLNQGVLVIYLCSFISIQLYCPADKRVSGDCIGYLVYTGLSSRDFGVLVAVLVICLKELVELL